jgi:hypothetical protein
MRRCRDGFLTSGREHRSVAYVSSAAVAGLVRSFWFAFAGSALLVVILWRQLSHVAHAGAA